MFQKRSYRNKINKQRFVYFNVSYLETDLWIGVDKVSYKDDMPDKLQTILIKTRCEMHNFINKYPLFVTSFSGISDIDKAPVIAKSMIEKTAIIDIGPMSSVAGAYSKFIGDFLQSNYKVKELVIENGGDDYIFVQNPIIVNICSENQHLKQNIGIKIDRKNTEIGICSSSAVIGHSISFGKADLVTIVATNTIMADAYATYFCNKIRTEDDLNNVIKMTEKYKDILAVLFICNDKIAIKSKFEVVFLN